MPAPTYNKTPAGFEHNGCFYNNGGYQIANFTAKMQHNTKRWELGSDGIVDHYADISVRAVRDGQLVEYTRKISLTDWAADREGELKKLGPKGSKFDDTAGQLSRAIEVSGPHPDLMPVRPESQWRDETGEYDMAKRLCTAPVQLIAEYRNPATGETSYRLRSGKTRMDVGFNDLMTGNYSIPGVTVLDKVGLFMRLRKEWNSQSQTQRLQFVKDEHLEHIRDIETKISALGGQ